MSAPRLGVLSLMQGWAWGGSEELWAACARSAVAEGWRVHAECFDISSAHHAGLAGAGVELSRHRLPFRRSQRLQRYATKLVSPLAAMEKFQPDVLLINEGAAFDLVSHPVLWPAWQRSSLRQVPYTTLVELVHDDPPDASVGEQARTFLVEAAQVLCVSERNRLDLRRHIADDLPRSRVVRNPVNLAPPYDIVPREATPTIRMASVARIDPLFKGQDLLLEALSFADWRERDWHLTFYGGGNRGYVERLIDLYGLHGRVSFAGHVASIRDLWAGEDLLVLPSRAEGTPLALVEAMLCGRPSVVTRVAGNDEWVEEPLSGFIAEAPTARAFAAALNRAVAARDQWPQLGAQAHRTAQALVDPNPGASLLNLLSATLPRR